MELTHAVEWLDERSGPAYVHLAFVKDKAALSRLDPHGPYLAVGLRVLGWPVGLGLAVLDAESGHGAVRSLAVAPPCRGRGIATALLTTLEDGLRARGCTHAHIHYSDGPGTTPALERVLQKCGWPPSQVDRLLFEARNPEGDGHWFQRPWTLPPGIAMVDWADLPAGEARALAEQCRSDPRYQGALLNPYLPLEPLNSLGLCYEGEIAGWLHVRRVAPDRIVYDNFWVRRDLLRARHMGVGLTLLAEALRRQHDAGIPWSCWCVRPDNRHMLRLIKAYVEHYVVAVRELRYAVKELDAP